MGHIHQHRYRHLGKRQADEVAGADAIVARQLGAPVPGSATSNTDDGSGGTILSVIYITASPTFTGAIGGYTTLDVGDPVQQTASPSKHHKSTTSSADDTFATTSDVASSSTYQSPTSTSTSSSSTFATMTSAIVTSATSLVTSASSTSSSTIAGGAVAEATASSTGQASASTVQTGMSAAGKTGLAIGILLGVAIIAAGVLFLYWKKKKAIDEDEKSHNEKAAFGADAAPMAGGLLSPAPPITTAERVVSSAPMLDLRPMSRLMPELIGQRKSQGNPLNTLNVPAGAAAAAVSRSLTPPQNGSPSERPANTTSEKVENPFSDPANPFGDEQAKAVSPLLSGPAAPASSPSIPAPLNIQKAGPLVAGEAGTAAAATAAGAGAAIAAIAAVKPPGSPASVHSSTLSQASVGTGIGPGAPPNNVHRVQIDFKPSMEDELELVSGQVVRILHEYDDGWALCIRLDRSQQGVAPRSCLSPQPVKPRPMNNGPHRPGPRNPRGPPLGPNGRPMTPNGRPMTPNGRPMTPTGRPPRPMSPAGGPISRPMTPTGGPPRPMSPARGPGSRPMTPNGAPGSRPMTPNGGPGHRFNGPPPPMSSAGGSRMRASSSVAPSSRPMSPSSAPYNQAPRPLSPGPIAGSPRALRPQQPRSMSPGPYGGGAQPGKMVAANQRRRSNSASALDVRERRNTPPGPSPLGGAAPPPGWVPHRRPVGSDAVTPQS